MTVDRYDELCTRRDTSEPGSRARIVAAATTILLSEGVGSISPARIHVAADVSRTELDELFPDTDTIVEAIVETQLDLVLRAQQLSLDEVRRLADLERWRARVLESCPPEDGCPLGSLIYHLARQHERGRLAIAEGFSRWQTMLASSLTRIQAAGDLDPGATPEALAVGVIAALQGGYLLAHTTHDSDRLRTALDMALDQVRSQAVRGTAQS